MNWKINHRVPEVTEWTLGIGTQYYPQRCHNCYSFPTVLVKFSDVQRRSCAFCKTEEYPGGALWSDKFY